MTRSIRLALLATAAAGLSTTALADAPLPQGAGANLTVHAGVPASAAPQPSGGPERLASSGTGSAGGISAGALSGPLGSPSAATSCRPVVHHVVRRRVVRPVAPPPVVASLPPPVAVPVYAYRPVYAVRPVYAYRPVVYPAVPYAYGWGYRGWGYGGRYWHAGWGGHWR